MQGEEDDHGGDGDTGRESGGDNKVVLLPEVGVLSSQILPRVPDDGDVGEEVSKVVRRTPERGSGRDHDGVDLSEQFGLGPLSSQEPVHWGSASTLTRKAYLLTEGDADTDGEAEQHHVVSSTRSEQPLGTEGAPEDGRSEESVVSGASEAERRVLCANILERHLEVEDTSADKGEDQGGDDLTRERVPRGDLGVMGKLEVVGELQRLVARDITVGLEPNQGVGIPLDERSSDKLGKHVHGDLDTCDRLNESDGYQGDQRHDDTEDDNDGRGFGGVKRDTEHSDDHGDNQHDKVDPLWDVLVVLLHQTVVDVLGEVIFLGLDLSDTECLEHAPPDQLGRRDDLLTVVEDDVGDGWASAQMQFGDFDSLAP